MKVLHQNNNNSCFVELVVQTKDKLPLINKKDSFYIALGTLVYLFQSKMYDPVFWVKFQINISLLFQEREREKGPIHMRLLGYKTCGFI